VRGEALGWHGSAMTTGSALGAPLAGVAIDALGWQGGFVIAGLVGLLVVAGGTLAARVSAKRPDLLVPREPADALT
jgi:MFS family permease